MTKKVSSFFWVSVVLGLFVLGFLFTVQTSIAGAPSEIKLGASIPKTGPLTAFGLYLEWGLNAAVKDVNDKGGINLSKYGKKVPVKLILYDDQSRPEKTVENVERLVLKDGVHGLLPSASPPLVLPGASIAEREGIPMVAALCPIRAFLGARDEWHWAWDIFFDEDEMTKQQFLTANMVESNKKVVLFTDNEEDGVVMGKAWNKYAKDFGYEIVYHATFPVGTTDYGDPIRKAKEGNAEIVICQMIPPDAIALWRQIKSLGYKPKAAFIEKGAEPYEFWKALGEAAQGVCVVGYWHPAMGYPGGSEIRERFEKETGATYSQHIADSYTVAQVMMDAIEAAGTVEPKAIAEAIAKTDKTYVVGPIKFNIGKGNHACALPLSMLQWQNGELEVVYPEKLATKKFIYPLP